MKGFVCGAFDFLHAGHISMLKQCKENCDYLVVGLHVDPSTERSDKNRPIETILERQIQLQGCKYVDEVIVYEKDRDLEIIIGYYQFDIRFLGSDYLDKQDQIILKDFIPIHYTRWIPPTSSQIRERIKKV